MIPALGTWASPDPLAVHAPGSADLNLYAYVSGKLLRATDPTGLCSDTGSPGPCGGANNGTGGTATASPPDGDAAPLCSGTGPGCTGGAAGAPTSTDDAAGKGAAMNVAEKLEAPGKVLAAVKANPGKVAAGVAIHAAKTAAFGPDLNDMLEPMVAGATKAGMKHGPMGAAGYLAVDGVAMVATDGAIRGVGLAKSYGAGGFLAELLADERGAIGNVGRLGSAAPAIESSPIPASDLVKAVNAMNRASGEAEMSSVMTELFRANGATPKRAAAAGELTVTPGVTQDYLHVYRQAAVEALTPPPGKRVTAAGAALQNGRIALIDALLGSGKVPP